MESITLSPARWIWAETNYIPNQWVSFRCKVEKPSAITEAPFYISVDTFDLAPFLRSGENQLEILVWHYGNGGRILSFHRRQDHPLSCISRFHCLSSSMGNGRRRTGQAETGCHTLV